jgi:hypothetical protein
MARPHLPTFVAAAIEKMADVIARRLACDEGATVESLEAEFGAALNSVGRAAMQAALQARDPAGRVLEIDGRRYWEAARAEREYLTVFGPVCVERGLYRAVRNGPTVCPMERRASIVEGFWTPRAARIAILAVADMTPYRASQFFEELGAMRPSRSSLARLPRSLSARWEADRERFERAIREADNIPKEAVTVAVSIDGVMLPMRGAGKHDTKARTRAAGRPDKGPAGYREAGCASFSFYNRDGERLKTVRLGRMPERKMASLRESVRAELAHIRGRRPDLTVVAVADGDPVLWTFLEELKPDSEVVDFYHAAEHLKHAIDLTEEPCAVATQARFRRLRRLLKSEADGASRVIGALRRRKPRRTNEAALYRRGIHYFQRHAQRMNYPELLRRHLPIGSGVVEGTCRWLVSDRMKRTGMRWDHDGGQAILTLRALVHSDRFKTAWPLLAGTAASC